MTNGKELYTKFSKKDLIRMWRTLKAESGHRDTISGWVMFYPNSDCSLRTLMDSMEKRIIRVRDRDKFERVGLRVWLVVMIILSLIVVISKVMGSL